MHRAVHIWGIASTENVLTYRQTLAVIPMSELYEAFWDGPVRRRALRPSSFYFARVQDRDDSAKGGARFIRSSSVSCDFIHEQTVVGPLEPTGRR